MHPSLDHVGSHTSPTFTRPPPILLATSVAITGVAHRILRIAQESVAAVAMQFLVVLWPEWREWNAYIYIYIYVLLW